MEGRARKLQAGRNGGRRGGRRGGALLRWSGCGQRVARRPRRAARRLAAVNPTPPLCRARDGYPPCAGLRHLPSVARLPRAASRALLCARAQAPAAQERGAPHLIQVAAAAECAPVFADAGRACEIAGRDGQEREDARQHWAWGGRGQGVCAQTLGWVRGAVYASTQCRAMDLMLSPSDRCQRSLTGGCGAATAGWRRAPLAWAQLRICE
jgi:hypothetical protein